MRFGVVWREVCLAENEYEKWISERDTLDANDAVADLIEKLRSDGHAIPDDKYQLAELILKFIVYPVGDGYIPYNYCAAPELLPIYLKPLTEALLGPLCNPHFNQ